MFTDLVCFKCAYALPTNREESWISPCMVEGLDQSNLATFEQCNVKGPGKYKCVMETSLVSLLKGKRAKIK